VRIGEMGTSQAKIPFPSHKCLCAKSEFNIY